MSVDEAAFYAVCETNNIFDVQYHNSENHKDRENLFIGTAAKVFLNDEDMEDYLVDKLTFLASFYNHLKAFYISAFDYIKKFPIKDKLLYHAQMPDLSKRDSMQYESVKYFVDRFKYTELLKSVDVSILEKQFMKFQNERLPSVKGMNVDKQWHMIGHIKDPATSGSKYKQLSDLIDMVTVLSH